MFYHKANVPEESIGLEHHVFFGKTTPKPALVVALGATTARCVFGKITPINKNRGPRRLHNLLPCSFVMSFGKIGHVCWPALVEVPCRTLRRYGVAVQHTIQQGAPIRGPLPSN